MRPIFFVAVAALLVIGTLAWQRHNPSAAALLNRQGLTSEKARTSAAVFTEVPLVSIRPGSVLSGKDPTCSPRSSAASCTYIYGDTDPFYVLEVYDERHSDEWNGKGVRGGTILKSQGEELLVLNRRAHHQPAPPSGIHTLTKDTGGLLLHEFAPHQYCWENYNSTWGNFDYRETTHGTTFVEAKDKSVFIVTATSRFCPPLSSR
jgi:hypothetical protein